MMLMIGDSWRAHWAGVQPLDRAPGDTGGEEDKGDCEGPAVSKKRQH
jgi:hypothetical protein